MGKITGITWTHHTFNPWWGCTKVSPGCDNCYAEAWAKRMGHIGLWGGQLRRFFGDKHWDEPLVWDRAAAKEGIQRRVFCDSMCDVFEDNRLVISPRKRLFDLINKTPNLNWLLCTKRPENILDMLPFDGRVQDNWPENIWLGVTAENQTRWNHCVKILCGIPAWVRFVSCEPLLGPIELLGYWGGSVDWIIVGGESAADARPMHPDWALGIRNQCHQANIPFFFKQWGTWIPRSQMTNLQVKLTTMETPSCVIDSEIFWNLGKKQGGSCLNGKEIKQFPP